jgi:putative addiction module killer protein
MKKLLTTNVYLDWLKSLKDRHCKFIIASRTARLAAGNPGNNRFLGDICELKIDYGPGYRVYYKDTGKELLSCFAAAINPPNEAVEKVFFPVLTNL